MSPEAITRAIQDKSSFLCVGLDTDMHKIPPFLLEEPNPIVAFNKQIIEYTKSYAIAYKLNIAFYESMGVKGWEAIEETLALVPEGILTIADAKRGDIGNTSEMYARTFFETFAFDAVTVAPYMGYDSVAPFLSFENKWVFLLALTSNKGASDFQFHGEKTPLFEKVISTALGWEEQLPGNLGFVVGATQTQKLKKVRDLAPASFLLVPGVGAQGGDLDSVCRDVSNSHGGILINSSRGIIYANNDRDFAEASAQKAQALQQHMAPHIVKLFSYQ